MLKKSHCYIACEAETLFFFFFPCLADNVLSSSPAAVPLKEDNCWPPSMNVTTL